MELTEVVLAVVAAVSATSTGWFAYRTKKTETYNENKAIDLEASKIVTNSLTTEVKRLQKRIENYEIQINELKAKTQEQAHIVLEYELGILRLLEQINSIGLKPAWEPTK